MDKIEDIKPYKIAYDDHGSPREEALWVVNLRDVEGSYPNLEGLPRPSVLVSFGQAGSDDGLLYTTGDARQYRQENADYVLDIQIEPDYSDKALPIVRERLEKAGIKNIMVAEFNGHDAAPGLKGKYMVIPNGDFAAVRSVTRAMHNERHQANETKAIAEKERVLQNTASEFIAVGRELNLPLDTADKENVAELLNRMVKEGRITINPKPAPAPGG